MGGLSKIVAFLLLSFMYIPLISALTQISTCAELQAMQNNLQEDYVLISDVDCDVAPYNTGSGFTPVGTAVATKFNGTFNGNGYIISGLYINRSSTQQVGLFGFAFGSGVDFNLARIVNATVIGQQNVGILVGNVQQGATISNSYTTGYVESTINMVGGLAGYATVRVTNSYSTATVVAGVGDGGGLVGFGSIINRSYATGNVTLLSGTSGGGLVAQQANIYDSYATGVVLGGTESVGGLTGLIIQKVISNTYATGYVNTTGSTFGGLVGDDDTYYYPEGSNVTNSFWDNQTTGQNTSDGGTGKTTAQMKQQATYTGWDFTNIWDINESESYPFLRTGTSATLPTSTEFTGFGSTNFSAVSDIYRIKNLVLGTSNGKINWSANLNVEGEDLDTNIEIGNHFIFVNTSALNPAMNSTAVITMENVFCVSFDSSQIKFSATGINLSTILSTGSECPASICNNFSCSGSTLTFTVTGFSGYAYGVSSNLAIYDEFEDSSVATALDIDFFANYTNSTTNGHISGASCNISFDDGVGPAAMIDSGVNYNYTKTNGFLTPGTHSWNVTCAASGYDTLTASDNVEVIAVFPPVPEFSSSTLISGLLMAILGLVVLRRRTGHVYR